MVLETRSSHRNSGLITKGLGAALTISRTRISGRSDLAGAIRYALAHWQALTLILRDGCACIDNSAAERAMRPIALGRRNWTFAGSDAGGERAAAMQAVNPAYIPRDHLVEEALAAAVERGDMAPFDELLAVVSNPFTEQPGRARYTQPAPPGEGVYQTFCGT